MRILVCAEFDQEKLSPLTAHVAGAALKLNTHYDVLCVGHGIIPDAKFQGVNQVIVADHACYAHGNAENIAEFLIRIADQYDAILAPSTTTYKNILPRLAAKLDIMMMSDVIEIIDSEIYKRPIYAGNAIVTLKNSESKKIMTIRTTAFEAAPSRSDTQIHKHDLILNLDYASKFVTHELSISDRPQLTSAKKVVSGGRGVGSSENFKLIQDLADQFGAAVGASRAAVDAGYVSNDCQVGQTGKVVAPDLYLAVGISGAIQHLAGMKDSRVIAAINKDPEAPIFSVSDIGLVADLFTAVPELQDQLHQLGYLPKP